MDKRTLLDRYASDEEDRLPLAQFIDKASQCDRDGIPTSTAFLNPRQQTLASSIAAQLGCENVIFYGAYEDAERRMAVFLPEWAEESDIEEYAPVSVLRLSWSAQSRASLSHRDFLGALMAAGLQRDAVGDILVRELDCDLIVLESVARFVSESLVSVGRASISITPVTPADIILPEKKVRIIRDTVASLRLDAIVSTGFSMSREKARELIRTGHAVLNNLPCDKPDKIVGEGDTVSARGFGKFRVTSAGNVSKKGRIWVEVEKYE